MNESNPARGCAFGLLVAGLLWLVIFAAAAVIVAIVSRSWT